MPENPLLSRVAKGLALLALTACVFMFARGRILGPTHPALAATASAVPLLAIGAAFVVFQVLARPSRTQLLKNLLLAATFLLWGVVELLPASALSRTLDEAVIALFVVDLAWTILPA